MKEPKKITRAEADVIIAAQQDQPHARCVAAYKGQWFDIRGLSDIEIVSFMTKLTGITPDLNNTANLGVFPFGECIVICTIDEGLWHLSISHKTRYPTYDEIKAARYKFIPDKVTMAMLFPPKAEFVNVHPNCFHLWELK